LGTFLLGAQRRFVRVLLAEKVSRPPDRECDEQHRSQEIGDHQDEFDPSRRFAEAF
jgi:hypothetical protein